MKNRRGALFVVLIGLTVAMLVTGLVVFLGGGNTSAAGPTPQTLQPGDNYFVCPGGANWSATPASSVAPGALDVVCPPPATTTTTMPPPTTTTTTAPPPTTTTTTAPPPTTTTTTAPSALWKPPQILEWQWFLTGTLNVNNATQMGTGVTAWNGTKPPATNPTVYDVDGIVQPKSTITALKNMGFRTICYIEVGTAGNYYTAAQEGIPVTYYQQFVNAGVIGNKLPGYQEWFLNINAPATTRILEEMVSQQCVAKGFDAVETDLDTTFNDLEGRTGFSISQANEETFLANLARYMNANGEVWFAKNLASASHGSARNFINNMQPFAAGIVEEEANEFGDLPALSVFTAAKKPALNVEFALPQNRYCQADINAGVVGTKFNVALNGPRVPCA